MSLIVVVVSERRPLMASSQASSSNVSVSGTKAHSVLMKSNEELLLSLQNSKNVTRGLSELWELALQFGLKT